MNGVIILVTVEPTKDILVRDQLRKLNNVTEAHLLYGPYDVYAKAEARTSEELENLVFEEIRTIKGIKSTMTCFLAD